MASLIDHHRLLLTGMQCKHVVPPHFTPEAAPRRLDPVPKVVVNALTLLVEYRIAILPRRDVRVLDTAIVEQKTIANRPRYIFK